jgi:isopentenyl phosphate kinase
MIVIKFGGSVVTHKNEPFTPNLKNLYGIARTLADYLDETEQKEMCIIHGGGSFAHVVASQHPNLTTADKRGISLITWSARKLNDRVVESLIDFDIPAFPLQTSSLFYVSEGKPQLCKGVLSGIIESGWIPVLYGDVIVGDNEAQIVSGEKIIEEISNKFDVKKIIVLTNVPGILLDVTKPNRGIIKVVNKKNIQYVTNLLGASSSIDVTGGMAQKVKTLYEISSKKSIKSVIIDGTDLVSFSNCLKNEIPKGTIIEGNS